LGNTGVTHPKQFMVKNKNLTICDEHKITHPIIASKLGSQEKHETLVTANKS